MTQLVLAAHALDMRLVVYTLCVAAVVLAENGDHSLYGYVGNLGGFHWMSSTQPTTNNCTTIHGIARSEYCGPGHFRTDQANVQVHGNGFKLTAKAPHDPLQVTNAQLYLCASEKQCASKDGTTDMKTAVGNQMALGSGTFVYQLDSFSSSQADGKFPSQVVLGIYLYRPNMQMQGNVDGTDELDIEYAGVVYTV